MKHTLKEMTRHLLILPLMVVAVVALVLGAFAPELWAHGRNHGVEELEEAEVFIEWNSTDGDFGIQFFWDSIGFTRMTVRNTRGKKVLDIKTSKNVRAQGLTEGFFESVEPDPEDLSMEEFLDRFPEGEYRFIGRSIEGGWLVGETEFTHDIPAPVDLEVDGFPSIEWTPGSGGAEIVSYEVVVEMVANESDEERVYVNTATFPATVESFSVSPEFVRVAADFRAAGDLLELKVEVIATEESGNRTITEETVWEADDEE